MPLHLERALAKLRLLSRRQGVRAIEEGRVRVNGAVVRDPRAPVGPGDDLALDAAAPAPAALDALYFALHKPPGFITARTAPRGRPTVYDLVPAALATRWVFPVGRLDRDSEGLLLFTNDGAWSDGLTDPRHHVDKRYVVDVDRHPPPEDIARLCAGVALGGVLTHPASFLRRPDGDARYEVVLREGRNRQIRRMFRAAGAEVLRLVRTHVGPVALGDLAAGAWRPLAGDEVAALSAASRAAGGAPSKRT